jgi:hypothetical protein
MLAIDFWSFKLKRPKTSLKNPAAVWHDVKGLRRAARRQVPGAVLAALAQEFDSCRRSPRRQDLNAVRCGGRSLTP